MQTLFVLALVLAAAFASNDYHGNGAGYGYGHGYGNGYGHGYGRGYGHGYGVYPDQYNALRQKYVNKRAEALGAGTGTYDKDGVPGTFLSKNDPRGYYH